MDKISDSWHVKIWTPRKPNLQIEIYKILCFTTFVTPEATQNHK